MLQNSLHQLESLKQELSSMIKNNEWHPAHLKALKDAHRALDSIVFVSSRPLVVFDLNGVLLERRFIQNLEEGMNLTPAPNFFTGKFAIWIRPGVVDFIRSALVGYNVAIWSSAKLFNEW